MRLKTRHTGKTDTVPAVRDLHVQTVAIKRAVLIRHYVPRKRITAGTW